MVLSFPIISAKAAVVGATVGLSYRFVQRMAPPGRMSQMAAVGGLAALACGSADFILRSAGF